MGLSCQRGQSTAEFALCLPFAALLVAAIVQVGIVSVDINRLWHAAREAARVAAVDGDSEAIQTAAESSGLSPLSVDIHPPAIDRAQGSPVTVTVRHSPAGGVPLIGRLFGDLALEAQATMRIESP